MYIAEKVISIIEKPSGTRVETDKTPVICTEDKVKAQISPAEFEALKKLGSLLDVTGGYWYCSFTHFLPLLKEKREEYRDHVRSIWKSGRNWNEEDKKILQELNKTHASIIMIEMEMPETVMEKYLYSVCGWSERHSYFRNKTLTSEKIETARAEFNRLKTDPDWGIPTVLIKETYYRHKSPAMVDFDGANDPSFSDRQELLDKHMCGNRRYRWKELWINSDRLTY